MDTQHSLSRLGRQLDMHFCNLSRMTKEFVVALFIFVPIVVSIVWCSFNLSKTFGKCDFEGYLIDPGSREELFAALRSFEHQHNLSFGYGYAAPSCGSDGINVTLEYKTPVVLSTYGLTYQLLVLATYAPHSKQITLYLPEGDVSKTEDTLAFIDSLKGIIAEFESKPQVREFATFFRNERVYIRGTIHNDASLWIETNPRLTFADANPSLSGDIFYSLSAHSIYHYSLPNYLTWREFPEIPVIHKIINENLLVGELSNCVISTKKEAYANTVVIFRTDSTISADVRMLCNDTGENESLSLILRPDGSYEYTLKK